MDAIGALDAGMWASDWLWSLPLIVVTVLVHVWGLGVVNRAFAHAVAAEGSWAPRRFVIALGLAVLAITLLHALEVGLWALAFVGLGALPDLHSAMLYSLGAMTTYGHAQLFLAAPWRMMGALEALNGMILFGLTTAFLFAMIQEAWLARRRAGPRAGGPRA